LELSIIEKTFGKRVGGDFFVLAFLVTFFGKKKSKKNYSLGLKPV
jgi:hypothetical protein